MGETYGLYKRGSAVMSMVRVSPNQTMESLIPENRDTAIVRLKPPEALRMLPRYGHHELVVLTNNRPLLPITVISYQSHYPDSEKLKTALVGLYNRIYGLLTTEAALKLELSFLANLVMLRSLFANELLPHRPD
jgi:indolepyruvate ferredoxin oxidoreductase beta subunit